MSFNETQHPRTPAGVSTGGQFATSARGESDVALDGTSSGSEGVERAQEEVTIAVGALLPTATVLEDDGVTLLFERGEAEEFACFPIGGEHEGRWTYQHADGTIVAADLDHTASAEQLAEWTRANMSEAGRAAEQVHVTTHALPDLIEGATVTNDFTGLTVNLPDGNAAYFAADDEQPSWTFTTDQETVHSASGLGAGAHPAAVAAWIAEARTADQDDLAEFGAEVAHTGITKAVAAQLDGVTTSDEGGGQTIWYGSRDGEGYAGDFAFIAPGNGEGAGDVWHFLTEETDEVGGNGLRQDGAVSDLPAGTDPAVVAAWVREQAQRFGSRPQPPKTA